MTLFDFQLPIYTELPQPDVDRGQVVITSGDVLLEFDPREVVFNSSGITGLGCRAATERAARHGVYCLEPDGSLRRVLQKPSVRTQQEQAAVDPYGETVLDIGVINFDAETAVGLLRMCGAGEKGTRKEKELRITRTARMNDEERAEKTDNHEGHEEHDGRDEGWKFGNASPK